MVFDTQSDISTIYRRTPPFFELIALSTKLSGKKTQSFVKYLTFTAFEEANPRPGFPLLHRVSKISVTTDTFIVHYYLLTFEYLSLQNCVCSIVWRHIYWYRFFRSYTSDQIQLIIENMFVKIYCPRLLYSFIQRG